MINKTLLSQIGFTEEEQQLLFVHENLFAELNRCAEMYMLQNAPFETALSEARLLQNENLHMYTADLLFVLACTSLLYPKYVEKGIPEDIYLQTIPDIRYKTHECVQVKHVFGIFVVDWYEGFLNLSRITLGRLQYDLMRAENNIQVQDYTIHAGDFLLNCHIPSAGPLKPALCMDSFKTAYTLFKDKLKNGILPIMCHSWLLYPPYQAVFGAASNTGDFIRNFEILHIENRETFKDAWRVFSKDFDGDISKLPAETSMQKRFIDYMQAGGSHGLGIGYILFDGNRVLTRK